MRKGSKTKKYLITGILLLAMLVTVLPLATLATSGDGESSSVENVDELITMSKEESVEAVIGEPIDLHTTVQGTGKDKEGVVRIILPGNVDVLDRTEAADDARITGVQVRSAEEVLAELDAERAEALRREQEAEQRAAEEEERLTASEESGKEETSASDADESVSVPAEDAVEPPAEDVPESTVPEEAPGLSARARFFGEEMPPEEQPATDPSSSGGTTSSEPISISEEAGSTSSNDASVSSEPSSDTSVSSEVPVDSSVVPTPESEEEAVEEDPLSFTDALVDAVRNGAVVLEYQLADNFSGDVTLDYTLQTGEDWDGSSNMTVTSAYNGLAVEGSFLQRMLGSGSTTGVEGISVMSIALRGGSFAILGGEMVDGSLEPLKVGIWDNGTMDNRVLKDGKYSSNNLDSDLGKSETSYHQWFSAISNGFVLNVVDGGTTKNYYSYYTNATQTSFANGGGIGDGVIEQHDTRSATVTYTINHTGGTIILKADYYLAPGSRILQTNYTVTNNTGHNLDSVRVIYGGDTWFAGSDYGRCYYNDLLNMLYVYKTDSNTGVLDPTAGIMAITGDAATRFDQYTAAQYSTAKDRARTGNMGQYVQNSSSFDVGMYTGWTKQNLASGSSFEANGTIQWTQAADIQIIAPAKIKAPPNVDLQYGYVVMNMSSQSITVNLSIASQHGWTSSIDGATTVTIPAGATATVFGNVHTPATAQHGDTDDLVLTANYTTDNQAKTATGTATTEIDTTMKALNVSKVSQTNTELVVKVDFINTPGPHSTKVTLLNMNGSSTGLTQTRTIMSGETFTFDISGLTKNLQYVIEADARPDIPYPARTTFMLTSIPIITAPDVTLNVGDTFNPLSGVTITDNGVGVTPQLSHVVSNNVNTAVPGTYTVKYSYTNTNGATGEATRTITVKAIPPTINPTTGHPANQDVFVGQPASFSVTATGTSLSYQWQTDAGGSWADISGATGSTYTIPATTVAQNNTHYRVVVSNASLLGGSSVTSNAATLTVKTYTVTYVMNGADSAAVSPLTGVTFSQTNLIPATNPTRTGYTFSKWTVTAGGTSGTQATASSTYGSLAANANTASITLTAQWTINSYDVTYEAGKPAAAPGGVTGMPSPLTSSKVYNSSVTTAAAPSLEGYTFKGWKRDATTTYNAGTNFTMPAGPVTLTAQWEINSYNVVYAAGKPSAAPSSTSVTGMPSPATISTVYNTTVTAAAAPSLEGYTFKGWKRDATTTYTAGGTFTMPAGQVTLTAQWEINSYNVTYNANKPAAAPGTISGMPNPLTVSKEYNSSVTTATAPSLEGYTFKGWRRDASTLYAAGSSFTMPAGAVNLTAEWEINKYNVTYSAGTRAGATLPATVAVTYNTSYTVAADTSSTGYTFNGWRNSVDGKLYKAGSSLASFTMPAQGVTLTAEWTVIGYEVVYSPGTRTGATGMPSPLSSAYDYDANVAVKADPSATGYTFVGWRNSVDNKLYKAGSSLASFSMPAQNVTLTAEWTVNKYNVTYAGGTPSGATGVPSGATQVNYEDTVAPTAAPTLTGYTFAGWLNSVDNKVYKAGSSLATFTMPAQNVTLTAQWTINKYAVNYVANKPAGAPTASNVSGMPSPLSAQHDYKANVTAAASPNLTGYTFDGWRNSVDGKLYKVGGANTAFPMPADDVTLTAEWTANIYTVSYVANKPAGASGTVTGVPATQNVAYNTMATVGGTPVLEGYTFAGWKTGTTLYQPGNTFPMPASNVQLTASWSIDSYTVSFDSNGGSAVASKTAVYATTITAPAKPTRANYLFDGWYKDSGLTTSWNFATDTMPAGNITLYAKWYQIQNPTLAVANSSINLNTNVAKTSAIPYNQLSEAKLIAAIGATAAADTRAASEAGLRASVKTDFATQKASHGFAPNATYTVTVWAEDAAGRQSVTQTVSVTVTDDTAPVIKVSKAALNYRRGSASMTAAQIAQLAGVSLTDDYASTTVLRSNLTMSWNGGVTLDVTTLGKYVLNLNVTDSVGNAATQVQVTVTVWDEEVFGGHFVRGTRDFPHMGPSDYISGSGAYALYYDSETSPGVRVSIVNVDYSAAVRKPGTYNVVYTTARGTSGIGTLELYQSKYFVTLEFDDWKTADITYELYPGEYIPDPGWPTKEGYVCSGWATSYNNHGNWSFEHDVMPEDDLVITAHWVGPDGSSATTSTSRSGGTSGGTGTGGTGTGGTGTGGTGGTGVPAGADKTQPSANADTKDERETVDIGDNVVPEGQGGNQGNNGQNGWALLNLIAGGLNIVLLLVALVGKKGKGQWLLVIIEAVLAAGMAILFILTSSFNQMYLTNGLTVFFFLSLVLQVLMTVLTLRKSKQNEDEDYA